MSVKKEWYVKKDGNVNGAFSIPEIHVILMSGVITGSDLVSRAGELWEPLSQVPELVPEEVLRINPIIEKQT